MLQRKATNHGRVFGGAIAIGADFAVVDENLGQIAVRIARDGG
jgi:hypothetical protein